MMKFLKELVRNVVKLSRKFEETKENTETHAIIGENFLEIYDIFSVIVTTLGEIMEELKTL